MKTLIDKIDSWIFREYDSLTGGLPLYRIFFACVLIFYCLPINSPVVGMPDSFFEPPLSVAYFFRGFPPYWFFAGMDYFLELGAFCLLFGYQTRWVSLLMVAGFVIVNSFTFSMGKMGHSILIPATLFCLAWSEWGRRYSADSRRLPRLPRLNLPSWPLTLLMLSIGLCMLTAAVSKAKSGWLSFAQECCRGQLVLNYVGAERGTPLADLMCSIHSHLFWKFLDWSTVGIEAAFIVGMFWLPAMRFIVASACLFHAGIYYSMDILFYANLAAYGCLVDFRIFFRFKLCRLLFRRFHHLARRVRFGPLAIFIALLYGFYLWAGSPRWTNNSWLNGFIAFVSLAVGLASLTALSLQFLDRFLWRLTLPVRRGEMIVLYDGECGLCDRWVQFVLKHDRRKSIRFAALQSRPARELLGSSDAIPTDLSSIVLWVQGRTFRRSDAILLILRQIGFPWALLGGFAIIPAFLRDAAYDFVAARRHAWFPWQASSCRLPTSEESARFLS